MKLFIVKVVIDIGRGIPSSGGVQVNVQRIAVSNEDNVFNTHIQQDRRLRVVSAGICLGFIRSFRGLVVYIHIL